MKKAIVSILFGLILTSAFPQQILTAKVIDAGTKASVTNAVITIMGDTNRVFSNNLGLFQLEADTTDILIISQEGYEAGKIKVPSQTNFTIQLNPLDTSEITDISTDYEKGKLLNDYRIGVWEYFDEPGKLALKIDYDRNEIVFLEPDSSKYAVQTPDGFEMKKVDRQPRYLGSESEIYKTIGATIAYPAEARIYGIQGTLSVAFTVGINGEMQDFQVLNDIGYGCGQAAVNALSQIPENWLPALIDHKAYPTRFVIPFRFLLKGADTQKALKEDEDVLPIATYLTEFVVTANVE